MYPEERDVFRYEYKSSENPSYVISSERPQMHDLAVVQVSDIQTAYGSVCPKHVQFCPEIAYVASGRLICQINDTAYELNTGDVVLIRKGDVHGYTTDAEQPARLYNLALLPPVADETLTHTWNVILGNDATRVVLHDLTVLDPIFVRMFEELSTRGQMWQYAVSLYVRQMLLALYRAFINEKRAIYDPQSETEAHRKLFYAMVNYIDCHIEDLCNLKDMAPYLNYSYVHLSHVFRDIAGVSLSTYYRQRRFSHAIDLLYSQEYSITQIAQKMGYQTLHAFSKAFSKYFGISPSLYVLKKEQAQEKYGYPSVAPEDRRDGQAE